jgi:hypothetical protein
VPIFFAKPFFFNPTRIPTGGSIGPVSRHWGRLWTGSFFPVKVGWV